MLDRREFFAAGLAASITSKADAAPATEAGEWRNKQSGVAYRRLGRTGYMISEVVMGGNLIAPNNYEHVLSALDRGLNYLDTAPAYGNTVSEQGYARVLKARKRDQFFLNSKISLWDVNRTRLFKDIFDSLPEPRQKQLKNRALDEIARRKTDDPNYLVNYFAAQRGELDGAVLADVMEREYGRQIDRKRNYKELILKSVDESLARLGTDHLDLLMCPHGASTPSELLNYPEIFEAFELLKKAGKARSFGVSAHTDPAGILAAAVRAKHYSAAMVAYNIVNHPRTAKAVESAHRAGLGVIAMKVARPVFGGRPNQTDSPERIAIIEQAMPGPLKRPMKAYTWALRNPNLSAVISEMGSQAIVDDNLPLAAAKRT